MEITKTKKPRGPLSEEAKAKRRRTMAYNMEKKKESQTAASSLEDSEQPDYIPDPVIGKTSIPLVKALSGHEPATVSATAPSSVPTPAPAHESDDGEPEDFEPDYATVLPDMSLNKIKVFASDYKELCHIKTTTQVAVKKLFKKSEQLQEDLKKPLVGIINKIVDEFSQELRQVLMDFALKEFDSLNEELLLRHLISDQVSTRLSNKGATSEEMKWIYGMYPPPPAPGESAREQLNLKFELLTCKLDALKQQATSKIYESNGRLNGHEGTIKKSRHVQGSNFYNTYVCLRTRHGDKTMDLFKDIDILEHIQDHPEIYGSYETKFIDHLKIKAFPAATEEEEEEEQAVTPANPKTPSPLPKEWTPDSSDPNYGKSSDDSRYLGESQEQSQEEEE